MKIASPENYRLYIIHGTSKQFTIINLYFLLYLIFAEALELYTEIIRSRNFLRI